MIAVQEWKEEWEEVPVVTTADRRFLVGPGAGCRLGGGIEEVSVDVRIGLDLRAGTGMNWGVSVCSCVDM